MRQGSSLALVFLLVGPIVLAGCNGGSATVPDCPSEMPQPTLDEIVAEFGPNPTVDVATNHGTIVLELFPLMVPITAVNFLRLAECDYYDGVLFHRVIDGFMIQGGDPNTRDGPRSSWGQGGPGYRILDEFHPSLRHDQAGVLSMANGGPHSGGSQFFITLGEAAHLDDKHAIFGRVASGMDVVQQIGSVPTGASDRPNEPVVIESMTVRPDGDGSAGTAAPTLAPVFGQVRGRPGGSVGVVLLAAAGDDALLDGSVTGQAADVADVDVVLESLAADVDALAGKRAVVLASVVVPASAEPGSSLTVTFTLDGNGATATTDVEVTVEDLPGPAASSGDNVAVDYVGLTVHGELFDTSRHAVANNSSLPKLPQVFRLRGGPDAYTPLEFQVGGGVIPGFSQAADGLRVGEQDATRIPPADGYGTEISQRNLLAARSLVFWVELVELN